MKNYQADHVIVGAGIAGMVTAIELLNAGQKVLLLDRDIESKMGGLAKLSFGGMFFVDSPIQRKRGIKDSPDIAWKDWQSVAEFGEEDNLPKRWAKLFVENTTEHVFHYLKGKEVDFFPIVHWVERGMFKRGNSLPRFHMVWGTGYELSERIKYHLLHHPKAKTHLEIHFGYKVETILVQAGKVSGVSGIIELENEPFEAIADNTIVATGGLGGDIEQVKKNWHKDWGTAPEIILNGAHPYADGTVHFAVEKVKGKLTHLDQTWPYAAGVHHPRPTQKDDGLSLVPPRSALWLNYAGERIGPIPLITAFDTRFLVSEICKQEKKYSWQLMNMKILQKEFAISGAEWNSAFRNKSYMQVLKTILFGNKSLVKDMLDNCIDFVTANTLEELVQKMNTLQGTDDVKLSNIQQAVHEYDIQIDRGQKYFNDEQLRRLQHLRNYSGDKLRNCKFAKINDTKSMPYVAIREFIMSRKTLGGIQTDLVGAVLDSNGKSINGLFAVGEAAGYGGGGIHGKGALEGTFLAACILTGRITASYLNGSRLIQDIY
ncbi:MAG: FAD-binding dehydrogenase [Brumimicrobium sp.]|nr:FAD-binding dehydrogenase [Brumimicrobium sp.]MCO5269189.1 FAD-binding dehydrogenase [Brumimicrobium sp.]